MNEQFPVGSREWLLARIAEHKATQDQALAQANAHAGAASAYQRLLDEMPKPELKLVEDERTAPASEGPAKEKLA